MIQYNQTSKSQHVRIGNWFEELKLKEDTGERYFPPQQDKKSTLLSKVITNIHMMSIVSHHLPSRVAALHTQIRFCRRIIKL